jgi:DNA-binding MarR family transcriptional regulator
MSMFGRERMRKVARGANALPAKPRPRAADRKPLEIGVLDGHLGYFIRRLQVWVFQDFIRTLAAINIGPAQYSVLVVIAANAGASQSQIAFTLGIERARLVRVLDKLEKRGLLERLGSPKDRRTHALRLTRKGQTTLHRAKALAAAHETRLADRLGEEQRKALLDSLRKFNR